MVNVTGEMSGVLKRYSRTETRQVAAVKWRHGALHVPTGDTWQLCLAVAGTWQLTVTWYWNVTGEARATQLWAVRLFSSVVEMS